MKIYRIQIVAVSCNDRDVSYEKITHIAFNCRSGCYKIPVSDAVDNLNKGLHRYFLLKAGREVTLQVGEYNGIKYLKSEHDKNEPLDLLALPRFKESLAFSF